jgi:hypothetical protein
MSLQAAFYAAVSGSGLFFIIMLSDSLPKEELYRSISLGLTSGSRDSIESGGSER